MLITLVYSLFHDLCDAKYLPEASTASKTVVNARSVISPFLSEYTDVLTPEQSSEIYRVVDNVSWSKAQAKRTARAKAEASGAEHSEMEQDQIRWEEDSVELHCVSDGDRLDAIGAFGILRCAAFSAVKNRTLHVPPKNAEMTSRPPAEQSEGYSNTAIAHFYDKLIKIKDENLWTEAARKEAKRRQNLMESFLMELDIEWLVAEQGAQLSVLETDG